ncbi:MAG: rod shape-determining protein [Candidatus Yonathbacteria bacterium]|nr:rod shape-determining protein [Candidatus Yonathbacteria bacterium]NTW47323.1 rod shape-determining protein [Candidatus Yonathbacteria bacterium]
MKLPELPFLRSNDIGIDLGTANTLVYLRGHGIIVNEPSVVALNQKTGRVVAVGNDAKAMIGRTPGHIVAIRPLVDGVISDYEVAEEMLAYFINKANSISKRMARPRVVVGVPSGVTNVQIRAVREAAKTAGAREVHIVEEPMAAAIGVRLPVHEPVGSMIIDVGGGTTDIAVISLGGIVTAQSLRVAGDKLNDDIASYIKDEFKILIGERTAEHVKIAIGAVEKSESSPESTIRGRDLVSGLPREVVVTEADIREAIGPSVARLVEATKEVLEATPPEILSDVMKRGIVLSGGGALITGFADLLRKELELPIHVAPDPLTCVVRGTGIILEDIDTYKDILIENEQDLPPK